MSLQAPEFFAELCLPFHDSTVVGATYYAVPVPGSPLRLRIAFTGTKHADTYGGLRLAVVHADKGEIDSVALSFLDHGTFHRRDEATRTRPNTKQHGTFDKYHRPGRPPWDGAVTTGLRDAIEQYTAIWFPGGWGRVRPQPRRGPYRSQATLLAGYPEQWSGPLSRRPHLPALPCMQPSRQEPPICHPTPSTTSIRTRP